MTGAASSPAAEGGWLCECGSVSGLWGVLLWLGGCRAMAVGSGSVSGASCTSRGAEVETASEVWGGTASPESQNHNILMIINESKYKVYLEATRCD